MKKKILFTILGIFLLATATAILTLSDGSKLISEEELKTKTDEEIQNPMQNNVVMTRYVKLQDKMLFYYNHTYLEPTHSDYTYNDSNNVTQTIVKPYKIFTQEKAYPVSLDLWKKCINKTTESNCRDYLVDRTTPYYLIENNSYIQEVTEYNNVSYQQEVNITDEFGNMTTINQTYYQLEPYQINRTFYEIINTTIKSTYLQAKEEQIRLFEKAKYFRDKANYNELSELEELI